MTTCSVCGTSDFDLQDGHYYCSECNTIIENAGRRQEEENEYCENIFSHLSITSSGKKIKKADKKKQLGEQWGTHQCFNIIICKQVEKLIQLGASPQLKVVVFYHWAKYLKKCEVAFKGDKTNKNWLPRLGSVPQARDIIILYQGETKLPNRYNKREISNESKNNKENNENSVYIPNDISAEDKVDPLNEDTSYCNIFPDNSLQDIEETENQTEKSNVKKRLKFDKEAMEIQEDKMDPLDEDTSYCNIFPDNSLQDIEETENQTEESNVRKKLDKEAMEIQVNCTKKTLSKAQKLHYNDYMCIEKTAAFCYLGLLLTNNSILLCDLIRWAREDHFPYVGVSYLLPSTMKLQSHDWRFVTAYKVPELETINELAYKLAIFLEVEDLPEKPLMPIIARFVTDINLPNELLAIIHTLIDGKLPQVQWKTEGIPKYELMAMSIIIITLKLLFGLNDDTERKLSAIGRELTECLPKALQPFIWDDWMKNTIHKLNFVSHTHAPSAIFAGTDLFNVNSHKTFYEETIHRHWHPKETVLTKNYNTTEFRDTLRKIFLDLNEIELTPVCPATSFPLTGFTEYYKNMNLVDKSLYSQEFSHCSLSYITNWKDHCQDVKICSIYNSHLDSNEIYGCDNLFGNEVSTLAQNKYWILHMTKSNPVSMPYKSFNWLLSVCSKYMEVSPEELYLELRKMENAILTNSKQQKHLPKEIKKIKHASSVRKPSKKVAATLKLEEK